MTRIRNIVRTSPTGFAQDAVGALAIVGFLVTCLYLPILF